MIPQGGVLGANLENEAATLPDRTYRLDQDTLKIGGMVEGVEAVRQAIYKILQTERYDYLIYSPDYGMERKSIIGKSPSFVRSELARRIREALLQDDRIEDVRDMSVELAGDEARAAFTVVTVFGNLKQEAVFYV